MTELEVVTFLIALGAVAASVASASFVGRLSDRYELGRALLEQYQHSVDAALEWKAPFFVVQVLLNLTESLGDDELARTWGKRLWPLTDQSDQINRFADVDMAVRDIPAVPREILNRAARSALLLSALRTGYENLPSSREWDEPYKAIQPEPFAIAWLYVEQKTGQRFGGGRAERHVAVFTDDGSNATVTDEIDVVPRIAIEDELIDELYRRRIFTADDLRRYLESSHGAGPLWRWR